MRGEGFFLRGGGKGVRAKIEQACTADLPRFDQRRLRGCPEPINRLDCVRIPVNGHVSTIFFYSPRRGERLTGYACLEDVRCRTSPRQPARSISPPRADSRATRRVKLLPRNFPAVRDRGAAAFP